MQRKKYKLLHKKLLRLRTNPFRSQKFLKLILYSKQEKIRYKKISGQLVKESITLKRFQEVAKNKREKWKFFLRTLVKTNKFFQKYKPYTFHHQSVSKFANQGNSFKKQFRKDLFTKKIFNNFYGGLKKKPLKKQMSKIYKQILQKEAFRSSASASIQLFESRLDSVLKRANFCFSIKEARQAITHKHVQVNGKIETNYSYNLKQGDHVKISLKSREIIRTKIENQFKKSINRVLWPMAPDYLNIDYDTLEIIFGKIQGFNFSFSFHFKNNNERIVENHYRH